MGLRKQMGLENAMRYDIHQLHSNDDESESIQIAAMGMQVLMWLRICKLRTQKNFLSYIENQTCKRGVENLSDQEKHDTLSTEFKARTRLLRNMGKRKLLVPAKIEWRKKRWVT